MEPACPGPATGEKIIAGLDGKIAVVVGCAAGIGARTARMIAAEGASAGRCPGRGCRARGVGHPCGSAVATRVDISSDADVAALFELTESTYGGCDVLANIAADTRIYMEDAMTDAAQVLPIAVIHHRQLRVSSVVMPFSS
jgi:NAD(P)-dependent dehydrogenase (short-subunit alcohol dehydrogenase family)